MASSLRGVRLARKPTLASHQEAVNRLVAQGQGVRAVARELGLPVASAAKLVRMAREAATLTAEAA
jgi:DNA-binding NarL/FixJ family response regulator